MAKCQTVLIHLYVRITLHYNFSTKLTMADDNKSGILYLFDRPSEPVYVPKGEKKVAFDIPASYLPDRYQSVADQVFSRFNDATDSKIAVKQITLPDLSVPLQLGRRESFSLFIPNHRRYAAHLIDIFMGMPTYEHFLSVSVYCRDRLNPNMFIYALSVAILHRPDTRNLPIPPLCEVFPDKYIDCGIFSRAKEEAYVVPTGSRVPIEIPRDYTAAELDEEQRVAYWTEDVGINLHHWHWHLVYPFEGNFNIVNKDRRGELFFYMHQQIMARYNTERLCNSVCRVKRLDNLREPIPEAYFPDPSSFVTSRIVSSSQNGTTPIIQEVHFQLEDLERWRENICEAIRSGVVISNDGQSIPLTEENGINVLGNIMEASILSPNSNKYGDLHNLGHLAISHCHDPDHRYLESFAIMGDAATAMRHPIFYRWHAFINDVFISHKHSLPEYSVQQLSFAGVEISEVEVISPNSAPNTLSTFWTQSDVDLSRGLDFTPRGAVLARFTHLNHTGFKYRIVAKNLTDTPQMGTVRIFMAPKLDENGLPFTFTVQKHLMIEMDKFPVTLQPGENTIERKSTKSSLTLPFERTFRNLEENRPVENLAQYNFCGCGWPQHMLIPKGNAQGYSMDLFVMISDYKHDAVVQGEPTGCKGAATFCGLRDLKYPDARSMGYPFDRKIRAGVETLPQFLTSNMATTPVTIRFTNAVRPRTGEENPHN